MKTKKFLMLLIGMITSVSPLQGGAQNPWNYQRTIRVTDSLVEVFEGDGMDTLLSTYTGPVKGSDLYANPRNPGWDQLDNRFAVKNGQTFWIDMNEIQGLTSVTGIGGTDPATLHPGNMIEVWGAGMLSYYYTAEGKDYYVSADVNYFGVTQWDGADLPAETILVVEEGSDLSGTLSEEGFYLAESELIGVPEWVNQSVWWKKKNPDGTNTTLFAKKKTCFLEELLSAALPSSQYGDQFTLVVMFDDGTSNGPQYNNSIEYYTVIDHRSVLVEYQLTFSAGDGGILSALVDGEAITSPAMLEEGTVVDFTATPDVNYVLEAWWLNGEVVDTIYLSIELEMWENNEIYLTFKLDVVGIEEIILSPPTATLTKGEQLQLTATVLPNNATNPDLLWSSSDPEVAIVDQSGLVTAFRPGKSLVRATAVGCGVLSTPSLIVVKEISPFSSQRSLYVEIEDLLGRKVPKNHPSIRMIKMIKMD